jgi:hypothetical protein
MRTLIALTLVMLPLLTIASPEEVREMKRVYSTSKSVDAVVKPVFKVNPKQNHQGGIIGELEVVNTTTSTVRMAVAVDSLRLTVKNRNGDIISLPSRSFDVTLGHRNMSGADGKIRRETTGTRMRSENARKLLGGYEVSAFLNDGRMPDEVIYGNESVTLKPGDTAKYRTVMRNVRDEPQAQTTTTKVDGRIRYTQASQVTGKRLLVPGIYTVKMVSHLRFEDAAIEVWESEPATVEAY